LVLLLLLLLLLGDELLLQAAAASAMHVIPSRAPSRALRLFTLRTAIFRA